MTIPNQIGRYEIVSELGHGAMGAVYKARDPMMDRVVAIKTILSAALAGPLAQEYRDRFEREARAAGRLGHPGIVTVYDVGEYESMPYLVMEFIEGRTLSSALDAGERFPFERICELGQELAEALGYAHTNGVIHRDIKPANILLSRPPGRPDAPERAKITDFGVAKLSATQLTATGQLLGTPSFMPPEQFTGGHIDGRSDLFSLGVILYWMATGDKPFSGDTITAVSYKIVHTDTIPPRRINPAVPAGLDSIIVRSLEKDPAMRYQTGSELGRALEELRMGRPVADTVGPFLGTGGPSHDPEATLDVAGPRRAPAQAERTIVTPGGAISSPAPAVAAPPPARTNKLLRGALAALLVVVGAMGTMLLMKPAPQSQPAASSSSVPQPPAASPDKINSPDAGAKEPTPEPGAAGKDGGAQPKGGLAAAAQVQLGKHPPSKELIDRVVQVPSPAVPEPPKTAGVEESVRRAQLDDEERGALLGEMGRAKAALFVPIPKGKSRLRLEAKAVPDSLHFTLLLDGKPVFRRAGRLDNEDVYGVFIPPGLHELRMIVGVGRLRLGGSNAVRGEFADRQERTLRIELVEDARRERRAGEQQHNVRLTLD